MKNKERLDAVYEKEQINAAVDEIKYELLKLHIQFHQTLNRSEKAIIESCVPDDYKSFDDMIKVIRDDMVRDGEKKPAKDFWVGTRMEVEMPVKDKD